MKIELMTKLAEVMPTDMLVEQIQEALNEYNSDKSKKTISYLCFVCQMFLVKNIMSDENKTSEDVLSDLESHQKAVNFFKMNKN